MNLGAFSVSLNVQNIEASRDFYSKLGFEVFHGSVEDKWLIMKNGDHVIGLFQGMFDRNMLTFNPGWDQDAAETAIYTDIREIQKQLKNSGIEFLTEADEASQGPASFLIADPDGNPILIDQHR